VNKSRSKIKHHQRMEQSPPKRQKTLGPSRRKPLKPMALNQLPPPKTNMKKPVLKIVEGQITLSCEHCLMVESLICNEHCDCQTVSREHFLHLLKQVLDTTIPMTKMMDRTLRPYWLDGLVHIEKVINIGGWEQKQCCFCKIESFLDSPAAHPWLLGLLVTEGYSNAYKRSIACMRSLGIDTASLEDWIETMAIKHLRNE
jgi:hypothetical protein